MSNNTSRTFSASKEDRDNYRPARGTKLFAEAIAETGTCVAALAVSLGMSETMLRKILRGELQFPLMDLMEVASVEPRLFDAMLVKLAALRGKVVIDRDDDAPQADRLALAAEVAKEAGEAVSAIVNAAVANDPAADLHVIREGKEAIAKMGCAIAAAESRRAKHIEAIGRRTAPRGAA